MKEQRFDTKYERGGLRAIAPDDLPDYAWQGFLEGTLAIPASMPRTTKVLGHEVWEIIPDRESHTALALASEHISLRGSKCVASVDQGGGDTISLILVERGAMFVQIKRTDRPRGICRTVHLVDQDWTVREPTTIELLEWRETSPIRCVIISDDDEATDFIRTQAHLPADTPVLPLEKVELADVVEHIVFTNMRLPLELAAMALEVIAVKFQQSLRTTDLTYGLKDGDVVKYSLSGGAMLQPYVVVRIDNPRPRYRYPNVRY